MPAERVLDEIEHLLNEYKINNIWFREENFFANKKRVKEMCNGIKKRGLDFTWLTTVRADYFNSNYLNDDFVKLLRDTGCIRLSIGSESGSQKILDYIKKDGMRIPGICGNNAQGFAINTVSSPSFHL